MKRYIKSATENTLNYNYYLLDFLEKLGVSESSLRALKDRSGNLRDTTYFGRGSKFSGHSFRIGDTKDIRVSYVTVGHPGRSGNTLNVEFRVVGYTGYVEEDAAALHDLDNKAVDIANHIVDVAESCDYITSISDITGGIMEHVPYIDYAITLTFLKPENHISKEKTMLDNYVDKYGLEFVCMVGKLFDRYMESDHLDDEPYRTKIEESGCSLGELEEIARYLRRNVSLSVDGTATYHLSPKSALASGSAAKYELPYEDYNNWLGK